MKIVVLSSRFPYPLEKGDKLRLYHQIRLLGERHEIYLISISVKEISKSEKEALSAYCKEIQVFTVDRITRVKNLMLSSLTNLPFQVGLTKTNHHVTAINTLINKISPDVVYCQLSRMAPYCQDLNFPCVIDYMDAFSVSMKKRSEISSFLLSLAYRIEGKRMQKYEKGIWPFFNGHIIISEEDKKQLLFPEAKKLKIVPNGVDISYFTPQITTQAYDIGMIGNLGYLPNIEAAQYILEKISPLLPQIKVLICGARPHKSLKKYESSQCTIKSWVPDIREAYSSIKILVAPIFKGTGQQNKILEAMAMGIPCITTSQVNASINAKEDKEILIADDLNSFVNKINLLLSNEVNYNNIKNNALTFVRAKYNWPDQVILLEKILEEVC